jgi:hypothetical protein
MNINLRLACDYYIHLLIESKINKKTEPKEKLSKNIPLKSYQYSTLFLYINFFNTIDYLKYKYFNKPVIEHKHLYEGKFVSNIGFNKEQSLGLETLRLFKQSLNINLLLNKNLIYALGFFSHIWIDPKTLFDYLKLFTLSLFSAPLYRNIHDIIINKHFNEHITITKLKTFKLTVPYYYILAVCDNFLAISFYMALIKYMKSNVIIQKEAVVYEDHLALYNETIQKNETFRRIDDLYKKGVFKEKGGYDVYLYDYMPGLVMIAGVITTLVYSPVDYMLQSYLFEGNKKSFKNVIFENKEMVMNRTYIVGWMNFFRFTFQYGMFIIINELFKILK